MKCACGWIFILALLDVLSGCRHSVPSNVAATVNNRVITFDELEKMCQSQPETGIDRSSEDEVVIRKLDILRTMIDNEIILQRAEKLGLMAGDADVEAKLAELKAPYTQEEFQKKLREKNMTLEELRRQLRRDLSIQKLLNKEITSHITITDNDVANSYNANKASFNLAEPQVQMAQIVVTPSPDPNVRNLKNDKAQNEEQAKKKIQQIETRLKNGEDFTMMAQNYSEDPNTAANGGDLGFVPESALEKVNVELRKMIMSLQPGQISPIVRTPEGYRILKVIAKEPSGQRELNDPHVQQTIRQTLLNRKDQLLRAAYYETARNEARIVNYFAKSIVQKAGMSVK